MGGREFRASFFDVRPSFSLLGKFGDFYQPVQTPLNRIWTKTPKKEKQKEIKEENEFFLW